MISISTEEDLNQKDRTKYIRFICIPSEQSGPRSQALRINSGSGTKNGGRSIFINSVGRGISALYIKFYKRNTIIWLIAIKGGIYDEMLHV